MTNPPTDKATKRAVLLVAATVSFLAPFMGSSINVALPTIGVEFAMDAILLSWVPTAYLLTLAVFLLPMGRLADIHGRKRTFMFGIVTYTATSVALALAPSATILIAARVAQGIGGAMIFSTSIAILTSVFPAKERGGALGISVSAVYLGLSLGPFLGGLLTQYFGWRSIFALNALLGVPIIALVVWKLKGEWAEARGERFDTVGTAIYAIMLIALIYGLSILPGTNGAVLIAVGLILFAVFLRVEKRTATPLLDVRLFTQNRLFGMSNLAAFLNYSATFAVVFLMSLYLQYIKGLAPRDAGVILVAQPVVMTILAPFSGRLSDRITPGKVASAGMAATVVGLVMLTFLGQTTPLAYIIVCLVCLGIGFGLFSSPNTNAIMSAVTPRHYGVAGASVGTMRTTGQMFSMGLAMVLLALHVGRVQITPEYFDPFLAAVRTAFAISAGLCVVGIFASLARGPGAE
jgi:EmrB/QacA subfamily drug resistance transporter